MNSAVVIASNEARVVVEGYQNLHRTTRCPFELGCTNGIYALVVYSLGFRPPNFVDTPAIAIVERLVPNT
jgi:hypothetical protein